MRCFGVVEPESAGVSRSIRVGLKACFSSVSRGEGGFRLAAGNKLEELLPLRPELLIFAPDWAGGAEGPEPVRCGAVLVPGERAAVLAPHIRSACAVSYGMSPRDTVTLSSINETKLVLALQRELVTLEGEVLERQEFSIRRERMAAAPEDLLAAAAGLLILGVSPEHLAD